MAAPPRAAPGSRGALRRPDRDGRTRTTRSTYVLCARSSPARTLERPAGREGPYEDLRRLARLSVAAFPARRARGRPARVRVSGAVPVVVRLRRSRPLDPADPLGADRAAGGLRRLVRGARVHAGRAQLAGAEPECVHRGHRGAAGRAVGAVGLAGAPLPRGRAVAPAGRCRAARAALGLADGRTRAVLAGVGRPLGSARLHPVAGGTGVAARVRRRGVAAELPGRGRQRRGRRPRRRARVPGARRRRTPGHRRRDLRRLGVVAAPRRRRPRADRRRTARDHRR